MEQKELDVILIIADISGYTKFMVSNYDNMSHAQVIITELLHSIINEVEIPLEINEIEGDAVFLFAKKEGSVEEWKKSKELISKKLDRFFISFKSTLNELISSSKCKCGACSNINKLKLKLVVHSGPVILSKIGSFQKISGVNVILVHRLLKNSIPNDEYVLLTNSAIDNLNLKSKQQLKKKKENYEHIGKVDVYYYLPSEKINEKELIKLSKTKKLIILFRTLLNLNLIKFHLKKPNNFNHLPNNK